MAYLPPDELLAMGFHKLGRNVQVSTRAVFYEPHLIELGDQVRIDDFCVISGRVTLGRNVLITVFCNVAGGQAGVSIGDFSGLAYGCHVFAQSEDFSGRYLNNSTLPRDLRWETKKPVHIGRHCNVGTHCVIVPGVTLADGTAVYAQSLVTKSTQPWSIYFGVPARRIKDRRKDMLELEKHYLQQEEASVETASSIQG
ncbi:MAG: acyltransferase [Candidatus Competibacteraceae bacterium]|nr:acyltransferase [Candidatus Competibacteraceae bacterium]